MTRTVDPDKVFFFYRLIKSNYISKVLEGAPAGGNTPVNNHDMTGCCCRPSNDMELFKLLYKRARENATELSHYIYCNINIYMRLF